jgi:hypothetical protein
MERHEADLAKYNEILETYVDGKVGVALPADCPCYVRFWRIIDDRGKNGRALKAVVLELDFLFHGLHFYYRFDHGDGSVKLMSELDGNKELMGEWVRA